MHSRPFVSTPSARVPGGPGCAGGPARGGPAGPCYDVRVALTDYEKYIRTEELLALQKAPDALTCHDELQFQIVHQAHELYMKLIEHELRFLCSLLAADQVPRAVTTLGRVSRIQRVLLQ